MRRIPLALVLGAALAACGEAPPAPIGPLVVASIPPLAALAAEVHVEPAAVSAFLPPGANPHAFEPTPRDVRRAGGARVILQIGLGFDDWAVRAARAAGRGEAELVVASQGVELLPLPLEEGGDAAHGAGLDPHIWLDPQIAMAIGERTAEALARVDPSRAAEYRVRAAGLRARLERLDAELAARFAPLRGAGFVATHAAWGYFARRYGLVQGAVLEAAAGREPGPRDLVRIAELARRSGLRAVFAEVQLAEGSARVVGEDAGIPVVRLDSQGGSGLPGRERYEDLLRWNAERMLEALQRAPR